MIDTTGLQVAIIRAKYARHFSPHSKMRVASLDRIDDKHATFFLLKGDEINGREWGVTEDSIPKNISTFIGKPYTITSDDYTPNSVYGDIMDHPSLEHLVPLGLAKFGTVNLNDLPRILDFQQKFRIGEIEDVFKADSDGSWRAIVKIDEPFKDKNLPPFVSPAVWQLDMTEPEGEMTKWIGLHLTALREKPAYGNQAVKKAECYGDLGECEMQLKVASNPMITPCAMKTLTNALKLQRLRLAVMDSGEITTERQNLHGCTKRDEFGNCKSTDSKKPKTSSTKYASLKKSFTFKVGANEGILAGLEDNPQFKAFTHTSSFVGNVQYDSFNQSMEIILNGKTYSFCNVSETLYDSFEGASSKGAFFNRIIKTQKDC